MRPSDLAKLQAKLPLSASTIRLNKAYVAAIFPEPMTVIKSTDEEKLNKTEKAYYDFLRGIGSEWIGVQNITFKLAHDTRFTPDFTIIDQGNMRCVDVKGFQREDALIKIKVAARLFPFAKFFIVKRENGGWNHKEVLP